MAVSVGYMNKLFCKRFCQCAVAGISLMAFSVPMAWGGPAKEDLISPARVEATEKMISLVEEMTALLRSIRNEKDAGQAISRVLEINDEVNQLIDEAEKIPLRNMKEFEALDRRYGRRIEKCFHDLESVAQSLAKSDFYKNKALAYALTAMSQHGYFAEQDSKEFQRSGLCPIQAGAVSKQYGEAFRDYMEHQGEGAPGKRKKNTGR